MSYDVTNISAVAISIGPNYLPVGATVTVDFLSKAVTDAIAGGYVTTNPLVTAAEPVTVALTSAAGTAAAGTVDVGGSFVQATLNNNFATVVAQSNKLTLGVNALQTQVRALEARLDKITSDA